MHAVAQAPGKTHHSYAAMHHDTYAFNEDGLLNEVHPLAMLVTYFSSFAAIRTDPDTMTLEQALQQPDRDDFIEAMVKEVEEYTSGCHWEIVPMSQVPRNHKPILMVWK